MPRKDAESATGLATSTLYELMGRGKFPRPVKLSPARVAWLESEISDWMESRIIARDGGEAA